VTSLVGGGGGPAPPGVASAVAAAEQCPVGQAGLAAVDPVDDVVPAQNGGAVHPGIVQPRSRSHIARISRG
jgi:hypothetical protein